MSADFHFKKVCSDENPLLDVIFIHGLTGDPLETWTCESNDEFWPKWLSSNLDNLSIYTLGYPASFFEKWAKKEMDIFERAGNVLEHLTVHGLGNRPIVFVTHSLGGLLAKTLIRKSKDSEDDDYKKISDVTRLVIFLATPHLGAALGRVLAVVPGSSKHIALLANETGFLEDLNQSYRAFANNNPNLQTKVYYEKHATRSVIVVDRQSSDPGVAKTEPTALDKNHINICKPVDKDDIVYLGVRRHISNTLNDVIENIKDDDTDFMGKSYSEKSLHDRRDLLQKLIDANREHEYNCANNFQNEFARKFAKTGLFTSARNDHESLLSEVETRYLTQIYHPLICKNAEDETVQDAIQKKLIDPISEKTIGKTRFSATSILCAMYYLTEQCHISWDFSK